ncbi:uncharacterized protein LOC134080126 isoform X1 [Sardina pilchardus]|uniref:uncharacterized protein LOC134080126 isoform X1 n=1 Tax=Sardina pilchardus TaxID=27697 RepID=UPI002E0E7448
MPERNARKEVKTPGRTQLVLPREPVQTRSRTRTTDSKKSKKTLLDDDMGTGKNTLKEDVIVSTPCNMKTLQRCPTCFSVLPIVQGTDYQASPVAQCTNCPTKPYLCATCLSPWQGPPGVLGRCTNQRCAVVGTLLTCGLITDPSKVKGCPEFRACPKCYSLLTHSRGCNQLSRLNLKHQLSMDPGAKKCPTCSSVLRIIQGTHWQASPVAQCTICPTKPYLCATCLYPWQGPPGVLGRCTNKSLYQCPADFGRNQVMPKRNGRKEVKTHGSTQLVVPRDVPREPVETRSRTRTTAPKKRKKKQLDDGIAGRNTQKEDTIVATPYKIKGELQKCPTCSSVLHIVQGTDWQASPVALCTNCPTKPYLCATCLSPWQGPPGVLGHCANKRCAVVGTLLTCGLITDPLSPVRGCPEFRACPKCYSLLTHDNKGCNNVTCMQCGHYFCYICLNSRECWNSIFILQSPHSKPAARQRFHV